MRDTRKEAFEEAQSALVGGLDGAEEQHDGVRWWREEDGSMRIYKVRIVVDDSGPTCTEGLREKMLKKHYR